MRISNEKLRRPNSLRLPRYDYSQPGAYFVTTVTHQRACLFGEVVDGEMRLNHAGKIVKAVWDELPAHYPYIELGAFVIMPNHVHGIIIINDAVGAGLRPAPTPKKQHGLSEIMRAFKSFSSREIHKIDKFSSERIWHRGFYDHIIRSEEEWRKIHLYIEANPDNWEDDDENPDFL
ncbi:MAG: transposase [Anaerolineae bacterium]|nr:transposase [Anaerolineae bacterium]